MTATECWEQEKLRKLVNTPSLISKLKQRGLLQDTLLGYWARSSITPPYFNEANNGDSVFNYICLNSSVYLLSFVSLESAILYLQYELSKIHPSNAYRRTQKGNEGMNR